jgi:putative transposase
VTTQRITPELLSVDATRWNEARRCLPWIRELALRTKRTRADVEATARALGFGPTRVYRLLRRYSLDPCLTSLLPRPAGRARGFSRCTKEIDALVDRSIEELYLSHQRPKVMDLVRDIRARCHALGLTPPGRKAITRRLRAKPPREVLARREGSKAARDRYAPAIGSLEASWPLSLVQIDHTLVDVMVVDSQTRSAIQRPWLTLAIDVCSRCVAGFYLSLDPPCATSVALCIAQAALPKAEWLRARQIEGIWPVEGLMVRLHLDNAKEFHSEALRRGCEQYGIGIDYRPVRTPYYGGHIERLIGTMMGKVHLLPGTTFSNVQAKGEYNPAKSAAMTLDELERWLTLAIVGVYHRATHRALGTSPLAAWEAKMLGSSSAPGCGEPSPVPDPRRFLLDFLPLQQRLVRRDGVALHSIRYWADVLSTWVGDLHKMIVRYDPRDLSRIYLLGPDGTYYDLPYRDLRHPPISLWEHRLALKRLRDEGRTHVDEPLIFRTVEAMRRIADDAVVRSKQARRHRERRQRLDPRPRSEGASDRINNPGVIERETDTAHRRDQIFPIEDWDES